MSETWQNPPKPTVDLCSPFTNTRTILRQLSSQLQEVTSERDQLVLDLRRSQAEVTGLHSTHISQQALERLVGGVGGDW